jgi:tetratricopeptide (TPR) repeat protein
MDEGKYAEAVRNHLVPVLEIDPDNQDAIMLRQLTEEAMANRLGGPRFVDNRAKAASPAPPDSVAKVDPPSTEVETPGIPRRPNELWGDYSTRVRRVQLASSEGKSSLENGDFAAALNSFRAVVRDQPGYQSVDQLIAEALEKQKVEFEKAMDGGDINAKAGKLKDARTWYRVALKFDPGSNSAREKEMSLRDRMATEATALFNRATFAENAQNPESAKRFYQQIVDMMLPGDDIRDKAGQRLAALGFGPATQLLTIAPVPIGGTLAGVDINCGTRGSVCSANYPEAALEQLQAVADPGYTFMGFVGDCMPLGQTQMTGPRTCSARFSPSSTMSAARGSLPPSFGNAGTQASSPSPPELRGSRPELTAPLPTSEAYSKDRIKELLRAFCAAYEAIDPVAVQHLQPRVDMNALRSQLNRSLYKSVTCKFGDPVFVSLDATAGTATVRTELKQVFEHTHTGEAQTVESVAEMTLRRFELRSPWVIDTVTYKSKPK